MRRGRRNKASAAKVRLWPGTPRAFPLGSVSRSLQDSSCACWSFPKRHSEPVTAAGRAALLLPGQCPAEQAPCSRPGHRSGPRPWPTGSGPRRRGAHPGHQRRRAPTPPASRRLLARPAPPRSPARDARRTPSLHSSSSGLLAGPGTGAPCLGGAGQKRSVTLAGQREHPQRVPGKIKMAARGSAFALLLRHCPWSWSRRGTTTS